MATDFQERCYEILTKVPKGKVTTYKEIANALGTKAYRALGNSMNKNPYAPKVPCHRVVNSDGTLGGFAYGNVAKTKILKSEGVEVENNRELRKTSNFSIRVKRGAKIGGFESYLLRSTEKI